MQKLVKSKTLLRIKISHLLINGSVTPKMTNRHNFSLCRSWRNFGRMCFCFSWSRVLPPCRICTVLLRIQSFERRAIAAASRTSLLPLKKTQKKQSQWIAHDVIYQYRKVCGNTMLWLSLMSWSGSERRRSPEDDQSILIETSSWNQRFFSEPPQLIRDSHNMVLPQTFIYRISTMQSFKSYLSLTMLHQWNVLVFKTSTNTQLPERKLIWHFLILLIDTCRLHL